MNNTIGRYIVITLLLSIIAFFLFIYPKISEQENVETDIVIETGFSFTGYVDTGTIIDTGVVVSTGVTLSEHEKYILLLSSDSSSRRTFTFPGQPQGGGNYNENTSLLNEYLKKNNKNFTVSLKPSNGYVYIKLRQPTESDVFLYRHNSNENGYKVSGKLDKDHSLISKSNQEFLYKLDGIFISAYVGNKLFKYNWQRDMQNARQIQYVGGYVTSFDGNGIEEITIAWE